MLIFVILLIITSVSFFASITSKKTMTVIYVIIYSLGLALTILLFVMMLYMRITEPAFYESNKEIYNSLTYQLENNVYEADIGKFKLYEKITKWNSDLAKGQTMQNNIFVGAFYHHYYYRFDFIEFPEDRSTPLKEVNQNETY